MELSRLTTVSCEGKKKQVIYMQQTSELYFIRSTAVKFVKALK